MGRNSGSIATLGRGVLTLACLTLGFQTASVAQSADTLRVGVWDFPPGRGNPYSTVSAGVPQVWIWPALFEALTNIDSKGTAGPGLATSWRNVDPTTWRVTLRPNVKFHNGETLSAKSVTDVFAWFASDAGKPAVAAQQMQFISSATMVDPLTVELKTVRPRPVLPNLIAALYIVPEKAWADLGPNRFVVTPLGSGSYRAVSWTDEAVQLEAFAESWKPAKIRKIHIQRLPEQPSRLLALLSGQIDVMAQVNPDEIERIEKAGGKVDRSPAPALYMLSFVLENVKAGIKNDLLKDKRVRQALNLAVNKEGINQGLLGRAYTLQTQFTTPTSFGYDPALKPWGYDPVRAKQLLAEAGYPNGFSLSAELKEFHDIWQLVALDLEKVGVKIEMNKVVHTDWLGKFLGTQWNGQTFDLNLGFGPEMDAGRIGLFYSCRKNPPFYCNKDVVPLLDAADSEFDAGKRKVLLGQIMAAMREDAPSIMLYELVDFVGLAKRVQGFRSTNRIYHYDEMTLAN
ncbi:MAG: ABC transporter substrate-binding protein [Alphaproteobacteria bacterium]|nr:ABC transporter substrate-binding protein [Alphaproteobacteria bacterium]